MKSQHMIKRMKVLTDDVEGDVEDLGGRAVVVDPALVECAVRLADVVEDEAGGPLVAAEEGAPRQRRVVRPVPRLRVRLAADVVPG